MNETFIRYDAAEFLTIREGIVLDNIRLMQETSIFHAGLALSDHYEQLFAENKAMQEEEENGKNVNRFA
jgi:hypothetical protein